MFSLLDVPLPSQIAGKNLASIFGIFFCWEHVGNAFCVPCSAPVVAGVAICVGCIPVQQVGCVFHHPWHDGMLACETCVGVVVVVVGGGGGGAVFKL